MAVTALVRISTFSAREAGSAADCPDAGAEPEILTCPWETAANSTAVPNTTAIAVLFSSETYRGIFIFFFLSLSVCLGAIAV